jgi:hypothetical protein
MRLSLSLKNLLFASKLRAISFLYNTTIIRFLRRQARLPKNERLLIGLLYSSTAKTETAIKKKPKPSLLFFVEFNFQAEILFTR